MQWNQIWWKFAQNLKFWYKSLIKEHKQQIREDFQVLKWWVNIYVSNALIYVSRDLSRGLHILCQKYCYICTDWQRACELEIFYRIITFTINCNFNEFYAKYTFILCIEYVLIFHKLKITKEEKIYCKHDCANI